MLSDLVIGYLFCGGAGAGASVLAAVIGLLVPRARVTVANERAASRGAGAILRAPAAYRRLLAPVFAVAALLVGVGSLLLVADLGSASRVQLLFAFPTPTFMTLGAFALALLLVTSVALAAAWGVPQVRMRQRTVYALEWLAVALGLVVASYTGFLLSGMAAVPFWSNPWLPVLFVASALSCGCAVVLASACFTGSVAAFRSVLARVSHADAVLLAAEAAVLAALLASAAAGPYDVAREAASTLAQGDLASLFYGVVVALGLALPLVLEAGSTAFSRQAPIRLLVAAAGVLAGAFALRYCIVAVGAHPAVWAIAW